MIHLFCTGAAITTTHANNINKQEMGNSGPPRPADYRERKPTRLVGEWISSESGQKIELRHGDITMEDTTAIVNAANKYLSHGSGM